MRLHTLKLILLFIAIFDFTMAYGQSESCEGSLGDPVITETFGAGPNPGNPLPPGITNMSFTVSCPQDGFYAIVNANNDYKAGSGYCYQSWQNVLHDHTGDPNGYMMMINASYTPSVFFTKTTPAVLCENTNYEFSAYILNLIRAGVSAIRPKIMFSIETVGGVVLKSYETDDIPGSANGEDWIKKSFFFKTPANTSQVVLKMTNEAPGGNGNDLLLDDINFRACGPLIQTGFTTVTANQPQNQCVGESKNYTLQSNIVGNVYLNVKRQWQRDKNDGNGWVDIAGETGESYSFTIGDNAVHTYKYRLAVAEGDNINSPNCRVFSEPLSVIVNAYPVVPEVPPVKICAGDALSINVFGGVSVEWEGPGITPANKNQNPLVIDKVSLTDAGTYHVTVSSASGCATTKSTTVTVYEKALITVSTPTATICKGAHATLSVSSGNAISYRWLPAAGLSDPSSPNPDASPSDTTIYKVFTTNAIGCIDSAMVTVNVLPPPIADAGESKKIFEGQSVILNGSAKNADTYYWTPVDGLDNPNSLTPLASPLNDVTYTLHVQSSYNCGLSSSTVFVKVYHKIIVPNSFSPNADGKNDTWDIEGLVTYPESITTVFNRYGQEVFKSTGYAKPWRGTFNGAKLPPGIYYYIIDTRIGTPKLTGWVLLVD